MPFFDLHREILEEFEEVQSYAPAVAFIGNGQRELEDTWLAKTIAYKVEYHRELDELRARRPRIIITPVILPKGRNGLRPNIRRWSESDDKKLLEWFIAGDDEMDIAKRLNRGRAAVLARAATLLEGRGLDRYGIIVRRREARKARREKGT